MERSSPPGVDPPAYPEVAQAFHIANFVPANWGAQDPVSRSLVAFRHGTEPETTQWIRLVLQGTVGVPSANLIIRALASDEATPADRSPLDRLGAELASRMGAVYEPLRLSKTRRTRAVKNAGAREIRDRLLEGAYAFDSTGLAGQTSILIIDDIVTTGATFAAIAGAIRGVLPDAGIRYLALGRTDPWLVRLHLGEEYSGSGEAYRESLVGNRHLDERYFTGSAPAAERGRPAGRTSPHPTRARGGNEPQPAVGALVRVFGEEEGPEAKSPPEVERRPHGGIPAAPPGPSSVGTPLQRTVGPFVTILVGVIGFLALAATVFVLTQRDPHGAFRRATPPEPQPTMFTPPKETGSPRESSAARPERRVYGTINVPNVGLRSTPSISSPPVPDVMVTEGERVILVRTFRGEAGPDWIFIQTARGTRGWVIAAVVTRTR